MNAKREISHFHSIVLDCDFHRNSLQFPSGDDFLIIFLEAEYKPLSNISRK